MNLWEKIAIIFPRVEEKLECSDWKNPLLKCPATWIRHILMKFQNVKDKETKYLREEKHVNYKTHNEIVLDSS